MSTLRKRFSPSGLGDDFLAPRSQSAVENPAEPVDLADQPEQWPAGQSAAFEETGLDAPAGHPPVPFVPPEWLAKSCEAIGLRLSPAFQPLAMAGHHFIQHVKGFDFGSNVPTVADLSPLIRRGFQVGTDPGTRAAVDAYVGVLAADVVSAIAARCEDKARRAVADSERAARWEEERRAKEERDARMARSEFERQSVLAEEAEARKWAAFAAEKAEFEAYQARPAAGSA